MTALLLIDIQNDYFPGGKFTLSDTGVAAQRAKQVLNHFRETGSEIIHIRHISLAQNARFFTPDSPGSEISSIVEPLAEETVIIKHFPNSFRETELLETLKANSITSLVICGMMTNICVESTVRAARDLGFECTVISDACTTRDFQIHTKIVPAEQIHYSFLASMNYIGVKVVQSEEFLAEYNKHAE